MPSSRSSECLHRGLSNAFIKVLSGVSSSLSSVLCLASSKLFLNLAVALSVPMYLKSSVEMVRITNSFATVPPNSSGTSSSLHCTLVYNSRVSQVAGMTFDLIMLHLDSMAFLTAFWNASPLSWIPCIVALTIAHACLNS